MELIDMAPYVLGWLLCGYLINYGLTAYMKSLLDMPPVDTSEIISCFVLAFLWPVTVFKFVKFWRG